MSFEEDVERLKAAYAAIGRGDPEPAIAMTDPEVEIHSVFAAAEGRVYKGHDGFRRWFADMVAVWEEFEIEPYEFHDLGDRVLLVSRQRMRGRGPGVALD